ncbi:MAG: T9SS type A sorting domain-containing protein [Dysgonamonadaceae bacterium]|nr:T9SS type A sorting domain-containing protein [Dysgonamonadaceae bacterium]
MIVSLNESPLTSSSNLQKLFDRDLSTEYVVSGGSATIEVELKYKIALSGYGLKVTGADNVLVEYKKEGSEEWKTIPPSMVYPNNAVWGKDENDQDIIITPADDPFPVPPFLMDDDDFYFYGIDQSGDNGDEGLKLFRITVTGTDARIAEWQLFGTPRRAYINNYHHYPPDLFSELAPLLTGDQAWETAYTDPNFRYSSKGNYGDIHSIFSKWNNRWNIEPGKAVGEVTGEENNGTPGMTGMSFEYTFPDAVTVGSYALSSNNNPDRTPFGWKLSGKNEGDAEWTVLDEQSECHFPFPYKLGWRGDLNCDIQANNPMMLQFDIASPQPFTTYRFEITQDLTKWCLEINQFLLNEFTGTPVWKGTADADWNNAANWNNGNRPFIFNDIVIEKNANGIYPELSQKVYINNIAFESGAETGGQNFITSNSATVKYGNLSGDRWYMLSMPLEDITARSFYLPDRYTFISKFEIEGNQAGWKNYSSGDTELPYGQGFALYADNNLKEDGEGVASSKPFSEETIAITGQLPVAALVSKTVSFGDDSGYGTSPFALAANPFMKTIDFDALQTGNSGKIAGNYMIWTGAGFAGYNSETGSPWGSINIDENLGGLIVPLQSFIVQRDENSNDSEAELTFNLPDISSSSVGALQSSASPLDKLDIVASHSGLSVRTFIADRENGQIMLGNSDARKLFPAISRVPDIYTLKESTEGSTAVGANIIHADEITVPLGITTTYDGVITLSFSGMDSYDAEIIFTDKVENKNVDLTGKNLVTYDFSLNQAGSPVNDRFEIYINRSPLGLNNTMASKTTVYSRDGNLCVNASVPVRQIAVYDALGRTVYANNSVNATSFTIPQTLQTGVYTVKVVTENGVNKLRIRN